ncbi:MAG: hypothetical protein AAGA30_17810 [Planctomycetota bacterium]
MKFGSYALNAAFGALFLLLNCGCAPIFNGQLAELISDGPSQKSLARQKSLSLDDFEVDHLSLHSDSNASIERAGVSENVQSFEDLLAYPNDVESDPIKSNNIEIKVDENLAIQPETNDPKFEAATLTGSSTVKPTTKSIAIKSPKKAALEKRPIQIYQNPVDPLRPSETRSNFSDSNSSTLSPSRAERSGNTAKSMNLRISDPLRFKYPPFANHPKVEPCEFSTCMNQIDYQAHEKPKQFAPTISNVSAKARKRSCNELLNETIVAFRNELDASKDQQSKTELLTTISALSTIANSLNLGANNDLTTPEETREFWLHQFNAIQTIIQDNGQELKNPAQVANAIDELNRAILNLREVAALRVYSPELCRKVSGFGQFESFEKRQFSPDQQVLLYCELQNFNPISVGTGKQLQYETRISSEYWIKNEAGQIIQSVNFPEVSDFACNIRDDFFMHLPIQFNQLAQGHYQLEIEVRDYGSGKTARLSSPISFTIR